MKPLRQIIGCVGKPIFMPARYAEIINIPAIKQNYQH